MKEIVSVLRENIREYGMYIALFAIITYFAIVTDLVFISPRNISDLFNQTGYIAVLAIGMTLVIIIRHIDLSVGFVAGFIGAIIALMLRDGQPVFLAIIVAIILGLIIGTVNGVFVAKIGVPAFVATLAGMLIFRGLLSLVTSESGTIITDNETFNKIGNDYIPDIIDVNIGNINHFTTLVITAIAVVIFIFSEVKSRNTTRKYGLSTGPSSMFILKLVLVSTIVMLVGYSLSRYNGISWTVVIVVIITIIYHFITTKTVLGRHIYAVGGNPEAAKLSGINVNKITIIVFASMGMLAGVAGILFTSRLQSASPTAGMLFELDAIAAAYVGGVSASGGVGKVLNSIIGALVMASLINGMNLLGVNISYQYIIKGAILVLAVVFDITTRNKIK